MGTDREPGAQCSRDALAFSHLCSQWAVSNTDKVLLTDAAGRAETSRGASGARPPTTCVQICRCHVGLGKIRL